MVEKFALKKRYGCDAKEIRKKNSEAFIERKRKDNDAKKTIHSREFWVVMADDFDQLICSFIDEGHGMGWKNEVREEFLKYVKDYVTQQIPKGLADSKGFEGFIHIMMDFYDQMLVALDKDGEFDLNNLVDVSLSKVH